MYCNNKKITNLILSNLKSSLCFISLLLWPMNLTIEVKEPESQMFIFIILINMYIVQFYTFYSNMFDSLEGNSFQVNQLEFLSNY